MTDIPADLLAKAQSFVGRTDSLISGLAIRALAETFQEIAQAARMEGERRAWQPIETAPRDGRDILVWGGLRERVIVGHFGNTIHGDGEMWRTDEKKILVHARYWQPLPAPPLGREGGKP